MQGDLFMKYHAVEDASSQKIMSMPSLDNMQQALKMMILFML
jgi:hypothetical protein